MRVKNHEATQSLTSLITLRLQQKIADLFNDVAANAHALLNQDIYFALQDTIIDAASDLGVVRAVATVHHRHEYSSAYKNILSNQIKLDTLDDIVVFDRTDATVNITINIPVVGNIQAEVRMNPKSAKINPAELRINIDGSAGTLWLSSTNDILDKVKAANLLSAPTITEVLNP